MNNANCTWPIQTSFIFILLKRRILYLNQATNLLISFVFPFNFLYCKLVGIWWYYWTCKYFLAGQKNIMCLGWDFCLACLLVALYGFGFVVFFSSGAFFWFVFGFVLLGGFFSLSQTHAPNIKGFLLQHLFLLMFFVSVFFFIFPGRVGLLLLACSGV